jgi:GDP-L-fucose synthase
MSESCLLTGPLEPTNQWYAVAKIAGLKLCQAYRRQHGCDFVSAMPTNLYGPGDNFDLLSAHVLPALLAKIDPGGALREYRFLHDISRAS